MDTNDLIRTLAADNETHERSVGHLLLAALFHDGGCELAALRCRETAHQYRATPLWHIYLDGLDVLNSKNLFPCK